MIKKIGEQCEEKEAREEENNLSEGERKPTPEKPEPRLETRNNLPNLQSIFGGEHYPNLEWQTWRKGESQRRKQP
ncbi:hypothetical protein YC2023_010756 [Brassica napus]